MQENPPQGTKNEAKQYHTSRNEERSVKLINMLTIKVAETTQTAMSRSQRYK